jgi:hypothetical protein
MKRAMVGVSLGAALVAIAWTSARGERGEPEMCAFMTPAKMLENPGLASEYSAALRSGEPRELARVEGMLREIREAHGCEGDVALPSSPPGTHGLPPGHPPIRGDGASPRSPLFIEAPGTVTI